MVHAHTLRKRGESRLRRTVERVIWAWRLAAPAGRHIHDGAAAGLGHQGDGGTADAKRRLDIDAHAKRPVCVRGLRYRASRDHTRIVDDDIKTAKRLESGAAASPSA